MMGELSGGDGIEHNYKALVNILCKFQFGLTIFHFNARSLNGVNFDYFTYIFEYSLADVICVSETWFKHWLPDSGYRLFRNDRLKGRWGGVAIYVRNIYNILLVNKSNETAIEYITVGIRTSSFSMSIACVYNPHRLFSIGPFFDDLSIILTKFDMVTVCGDFNVDLLRNDSVSNALKGYASATGLLLVNDSMPTRFGNQSCPSLLDIFLVTDLCLVNKFEQFTFMSDHDLIFCSLAVPMSTTLCSRSYSFRDYKSINYHVLAHDLSLVNWSDCWCFGTVDEKLNWFMTNLMCIFERNVPLKTRETKGASCPWLTGEVISLIKIKNALHSKWKRCQSQVNWVNP